MPWRITVLLTNLALDGGAEVQGLQLALRLKERGWNVSVVGIRAVKDALAFLAANKIPVFTLDRSSKLETLFQLPKLARAIATRKPHIVHAHMDHAIVVARLLRAFVHIPVLIGTIHSLKMYNVRGTGWRLREFVNRLTDSLSDVTSVVCGAAARHYLSSGAVSRGRLRVIPNGIDTEAFRADLKARSAWRERLGIHEEFTWLMVGRFDPVKDHCMMLRAFARFCGVQRSALLLLAGDGPLESEMTELAMALGIGDRVRFLGRQSSIPALMNAADACVLSSRFEALPLVLLEAAATGLPAVATDIGGNSDVVLDGMTGYLSPVGDPEALAQAMLRLASLPAAARAAMGARAREHVVANFDFASVIETWENLYSELLERNGVRQ
jgi:glycosyltransferase involved in cell wall biosynthesis